MNDLAAGWAEVAVTPARNLTLDMRLPLPNEPRAKPSAAQAVLTERYLLPSQAELEAFFLAVRTLVDPHLQRAQPVKLGKPYPLGQCLEITQAVQQRLRRVQALPLSGMAAQGRAAFSAFLAAGGALRQVWGDLRGEFFQNAFQLGTLYVDVSNDTVTPTKPKVEILPFHEAQFVPIRDFGHFRQVARSYWHHEVYPNHVLPALAPHCPLIHVSKTGRIMLHEATQYMLALTRSQAFAPSEPVLREAPVPPAVFEQVRRALREAGYRVPASAEQGRQQALQQCRLQRAKRWHLDPQRPNRVILDARQVNLHLARWHQQHIHQEKTMPSIKIDNIDYDLDSLSDDAKAQLQSIQFVDQELAKLQMQVAAMQTARMAYANALKAALPTVASGDTIKLS